MGRLRVVLLLLVAAALPACTCQPDDGWPHAEDGLWRAVLDPSGAHGFPAGRPAILLHAGDHLDRDALIVGYEGAVRSRFDEAGDGWGPCADPALGRGIQPAWPAEAPAHAGLAWLGPSTRVEIPKPPANPAATVALAQTALRALAASLAGPDAVPGPEASVRSVLKLRRPHAPPMLLATGDAGCRGFVALLDADGTVLVSDEVALPGPTCAPLAAMPPADLDGDGVREVGLRAGNGAPGVGVFRAVYRLDPTVEPPRLERVWREVFTPDCG